jgi:hypothetical protein
MDLEQEWLQQVVERFYLPEEQKEERKYLHNISIGRNFVAFSSMRLLHQVVM